MPNNSILIKSKPLSPGRRHLISLKKVSSKNQKLKALCSPKKSALGRSAGKISSQNQKRSAGNKKTYRQIDFKRKIFEIPATVQTIEYDPNRSSNISLIKYETGEMSYILAPDNIKIGDVIVTSQSISGNDVKPGIRLPLSQIPIGTLIHCIEMKPEKGSQVVRSAGCSARLIGRESSDVLISMPSGEIRKFQSNCMATIGEVSLKDHKNRVDGKAGRNRWRGWSSAVRGEAKNPVDHPHGGRTRGGRIPTSASGLRKGTKTSRNFSKKIVKKRK